MTTELIHPTSEGLTVREGHVTIDLGSYTTIGELRSAIDPFSDDTLVDLASAATQANEAETQEPLSLYGGLVLVDYDTHDVICTGTPIGTTYQEFRMFDFMGQNPGVVMTRNQILTGAWDESYQHMGKGGGERTVDVHVRRLRARMEEVDPMFGDQSVIATRRSVGYLMTRELQQTV